MQRRFYPGAPRDIDEAARKISRILDREGAAGSEPQASAAQPTGRGEPGSTQLAGSGLSDDDIFNMLAFDNTGKWEQFRDRVYYDRVGVPTVGYGYVLVVDGPHGWTARDDANLQSVDITLAPGDRQRLDQVAQTLENNRNAKPAVRRTATEQAAPMADYGTTLTEDAARDTFDLAVPTYKKNVTDAIGQSRFDRLFPEQQAALFDLAYRNPSWLLNNGTRLGHQLDADYAAGTTANTAAALRGILPPNDARAQGAIDYFQNPKAEWLYQVRPGDVFARDIAPKIGVTRWDEIAPLNPHITNPARILSGQRIYFPAPQVTRRSGRMP
jgi:hypothetical protein